ncbi:hypothetical protein EON82_14230 [bacterium]|nr:MAG: hypothetical protein EON82_14230 [bacterium]
MGPEPRPWCPDSAGFIVYEVRPLNVRELPNERIVFRAVYAHRFVFKCRQRGPLVYSLTLLPQEERTIYEFERHRRTNSSSSVMSSRGTFYQYLSNVGESAASSSSFTFDRKSDSSSVSGGGSAGIDLGFFSIGGGASAGSSSSDSSGHDVSRVASTFNRAVQITSQTIEVSRSVVVSQYEDDEKGVSTSRKLKNANRCRSVTYYASRIYEKFVLSTILSRIEVRLPGSNVFIPIEDVDGPLRDEIRRLVESGQLPRGGTTSKEYEVGLPTDGLLWEAELGYCDSCEPQRDTLYDLEVELAKLEVQRRTALLAAGTLDPFEPAPVPPV